MRYEFELFADYFQIYLRDVESKDDTSEIWSEEALSSKLGIMPNTLAVGTFRNVDVLLAVEVYDTKPDITLEEWDHIAIGYFTITSGKCAVFGCTDYFPDARKIDIKPGHYSVYSLAKGLDTITDESQDADDFYEVLLWPSSEEEFRSLKAYANT